MQAVQDALIVAGGLGTRMFPVSAMQAKETLPLVDVPLLTHLILEAKAAGATRIHIILSPKKNLDGFLTDRSELASYRPDLDSALFNPIEGLEVRTHYQMEPKGLGNAIETALDDVQGPFLVLLGDNVLLNHHAPSTHYEPSHASLRLVEHFMQHNRPTVGLLEVPESHVHHYGIVEMEGHRIVGMVEKPSLEEAPSRLALCGRYLFPRTTQALLKQFDYDTHGEMQSIALQQHWMNEGELDGVQYPDMQWYDSGTPLMWLQAQVDHALRRPEYEDEMRAWLDQRLDR